MIKKSSDEMMKSRIAKKKAYKVYLKTKLEENKIKIKS